jgi:hypothetical protein
MTGTGTLLDPYVIWDVNDLQAMNLDLTAFYELGQNIDASATVGWNLGAGFVPVGTLANPFRGNFNGRTLTITGLFINRPGTQFVGLFGYISGATVTALLYQNFNVTGQGCTGALIGYVFNASDISYCLGSNITVVGNSNSVGGLIGFVAAGVGLTYVRRCYVVAVNVTEITTATAITGGLIGQNSANGRVSECFSDGIVRGLDTVGGLIGGNAGIVTDCYSRVRVTGVDFGFPWNTQAVAGFVGATGTNIVSRSYSTGLVVILDSWVPGGINNGGFAGQCGGGVCAISFWDVNTSGWLTSACGVGKTTAQMKDIATFLAAGWDFVKIWNIDPLVNDGYPYLRWLNTPSINVVSPNGGEVWNAGSTHPILWTSSSPNPYGTCGTDVRIELFRGGGFDEVIIASTPIGTPGNGNYAWPINANKPDSNLYRVRIASTTVPISDQSDNDFTIRRFVAPIIQVVTLPATEIR